MPLTVDEQKQFTYLNLLAFDIARKSAGSTKIPTWLCSSEETRQQYQEEARQLVIKHFGTGDLEQLLKKSIPSSMLEAWIKAETIAKKLREANDPTAFFC